MNLLGNINLWEILKKALPVMWPLLWRLFLIVFLIELLKFLLDKLDYEIKGFRLLKRLKQGEQWRSSREMIRFLRNASPKEFEQYIGELFKKLGFVVEVTGGPYDGGVDLIITKDGISNYVQCKRYNRRNNVGVKEVRDFYGAMADKLAKGKGYFVTTGIFTLEAENFAEDKPIELIDSNKLIKYMNLSGLSDKEIEIKKCKKCDGEMVKRKGKFGFFLGCINYPKCDYTCNFE